MITFIVLIVLTTLFTALRVISKFITQQDWWWDDFFAILALVCMLQCTVKVLHASDWFVILRSRWN